MSAPPKLSQEQIDALLDQIKVPSEVRLAGTLLALEGLFVLLYALQSVAFIRWRGVYKVVPVALMVPAVATLLAAVGLVRARSWSLRASLLAIVVLLLADCGWLGMSFLAGVLSPLGIATVGGGMLALFFIFIAMQPFAKVATARRELREAGYDVDL